MQRRRKKMKKRLKGSTGITLVALVVTIVILLILSGITIMYTIGDNSIFKKAQEAKDKTENAIKNEQEYMNSIDNMINEYTNGMIIVLQVIQHKQQGQRKKEKVMISK